MASPILSVQVGMGEEIILATFVVVVIGGVGSVKGAFVAGIGAGHDRHHAARLSAGPAAQA